MAAKHPPQAEVILNSLKRLKPDLQARYFVEEIGLFGSVLRGEQKKSSDICDRKTINAVIRSLEVMGEAAKRIPEEIHRKYPGIPWKRMAGMRDKLIHEYAGVDLETVWDVITEELPPLKPLLEKLAGEME